MTAGEHLDIEALLVRAYREKQVHRLTPGGSARAALGAALGLVGPALPGCTLAAAERVDTSSYGARAAAWTRAALGRLANAPDALLDLHDHVLALPNFFVEDLGDLDFAVWDFETARRLGQRITVEDAQGSRAMIQAEGGAGVPDGPMRRLRIVHTANVLIQHAAEACRPDVSAVVVARYRPVYEGARKEPARHEPIFETPLESVVYERAVYQAWHAALGMLVDKCRALPGLAVTGPLAPVAPWEVAAPVLPSQDPPAPGQQPRRTRACAAQRACAVARTAA